MALRKHITVLLAVVAIVLVAALWAEAQQPRSTQGDGFVVQPQWSPVAPVAPTVLSDSDLGFRVLAMRGQTPVGEWVVRINGEWRRVEAGTDPRRQMR